VSLLFCDSFAFDDNYFKWGTSTFTYRKTTSPRRAGGAYLSGGGAYEKTITPSAEVIVSAAVRFTGSTAVHVFSCLADAGTTGHVGVSRSAAGKLEIRRGSATSGTLLATGTTTIANNVWTTIEVRATVADSGGIAQLRINGDPTNEAAFTGDTKNGGSSTNIDMVRFGFPGVDISDPVICNALGSAANTWMGDRTVERILPNGAGTYTQGTPDVITAGSSHWTLVDETSLITQGSDCLTLAAGQKETVTFTDPTITNSIGAVQVCAHGKRTTGTAAGIRALARIGGVDYTSASVIADTAYATTVLPFDRNPATSTAWTVSAVNALEAGIEQLTGGSGYELDVLYVETVVSTVASGPGVEVHGGGSITVVAAPIPGGAVAVHGGGTVTVGDIDTDTGRPVPTTPTLTIPALPVIRRESLTWPAPTLVDGVPQDWTPE
jgi:hypothetical protein